MHKANHCRYHYKCLKIARGKVKEDDKYTCPICDWRMKIPRDAARPKIEDLTQLIDEIPNLPFQPEEEEVLENIVSNAQDFRDYIARYCNPLLSTEAEAETQRFYLRKLEGAEVLLAYETNFFRQELHKWYPVAPEAPPILEVSLSTRKPRPTKLQKMLVEYGVENPDDLPDHAKGKANSLRRKAANAEAAAAAALAGQGSLQPPSGNSSYGGPADYARGQDDKRENSEDEDEDQSGPDGGMEPDHSSSEMRSKSSRELAESIDDIDIETVEGKAKALEILGRSANGRKQAEKIWGDDVWTKSSSLREDGSGPKSPKPAADMLQEEAPSEKMLTDTNEDTTPAKSEVKKGEEKTVTTASLEDERNGLDAMIDGE